ncbi:ArsR/SmtB family transcription factor [Kitasatospora sp. NPDC059463]|uniref:ArsR/SmtB family transcription factor n=1 Tax=unclassified Kitasatospora TaxID=2633591 RepID=UPI00369470B9
MVENTESAENADEEPAAPGPATPGPGSGPGALKERRVEDAATLKALADPLRLAILDVLMAALASGPLTAKEIAAALDEPQTKLYRHIKQLEKAGLVRVAGTRLVSGIVESRYAPAQDSLRLAPEIFSPGSPTRAHAYGAILAAMDRVRGEFHARAMADRVDFTTSREASAPGLPGMFSHFTFRLTPDRMLRLRGRLDEILDELRAEGESDADDAVEATLFTLLYGVRPGPAGDSRTDTRPGTES